MESLDEWGEYEGEYEAREAAILALYEDCESHFRKHGDPLDDPDCVPDAETVRATYATDYYMNTVRGSKYDELERAERFDRWLAAHDRQVQAEALREAAVAMRAHKDPGHWNLRDERDPANASQSPDAWIEVRADRIEKGSDDER